MASAVKLLERATALLASDSDTSYRAEVLGSLLIALSETGQFENSTAHAATIEEMADRNLDSRKVAALHVQLANLEHMAGRWSAALTQVATARTLLGIDAGDADLAPVDAIAAHLELARPSPGRLKAATELATRAAEAAERAKLPAVACDALQLLGILSREHDLDRSIDYFHRARLVAEEHNMTFQRVCSHIFQAGTICLANGSIVELERARQQALRIGAIPLAYEVDGILGQQAILRSEYDKAAVDHRRVPGDHPAAPARPLGDVLPVHQGDPRGTSRPSFGDGGDAGRGRQLGWRAGVVRAAVLLRTRADVLRAAGGEPRAGRLRDGPGPRVRRSEPDHPAHVGEVRAGAAPRRTVRPQQLGALRGDHGCRRPVGCGGTSSSSSWRTPYCSAGTVRSAAARRQDGRRRWRPRRSTRWRATWVCGWWPSRRTPTAGASRSRGCGRPRTTSTTRRSRRWPVRAVACCGSSGRRSPSAGAGSSRCRASAAARDHQPRVRGLPAAGGPDREQVDRVPAAHLATDRGEACGEPDDQDTATGSGGTEQFRPDRCPGLSGGRPVGGPIPALMRVLERGTAGG